MSRAIASARQRRAGISTETPPPIPTQQSQPIQNGQGLTLPQVITLVDTRLIKLEKFMKETQQQDKMQMQPQMQTQEFNLPLINEFQERFDLLAQELMDLKNIVLKLQSYTMEVNKMLLEEREELPTEDNMFTLQTLSLQNIEQQDIMSESINISDE